MEPVKRIVVNTVVQYVKAFFNICLSLYSTRLILDALSVSDYGVYSVVGGVVAMLGFVTNALVITTQRYVSYYHANIGYVSRLFSNSLLLHLLIGIGLGVVLLIPGDWLVGKVLNIEESRLLAASHVYALSVLMLFITILTAPFKALFIARENIVYVSIVEMSDGVLKLALAVWLMFVSADKLLVYAYGMALILLVNFFAFAIYAVIRFEECHVLIRKRDIDKDCLMRLMGFAGWTTYGMGAIATRNQGIAMIFNHFFGTVINAAYGIAFQVYGAVSFVATSVLNAMNPQIMKAEGEHDRAKVLFLAARESKYSSMLMALVAIPLTVEMPAVLGWWLKETPEGTVLFCRAILVGFLLDQLTYGLHTANQALGKIRNYTFLIYTPKLLVVPMVWLLLRNGFGVHEAMWLYVGVELLMSFVRLPFLKHTAGLCVWSYVTQVFLPLLPSCAVLCGVSLLCGYYGVAQCSVFLAILLPILAGGIAVWCFTFDRKERNYVKSLVKKRRSLEC